MNVAHNYPQEMPRRFDVLRIEQKGRGPETKLVISKIKTLSCENFYGITGDYAITSYLHPDDLYEKVEILNWRTSSSSEYSTSSLTLKIGAVSRDFFPLLPLLNLSKGV